MTGLDGSLGQMAHSATFPAWVAVISVAIFGTLFIATMLRADRSPANAALAALTFVGLAVLTAVGLNGGNADTDRAERSPSAVFGAVPSLACLDDLAGEATLAACEKSLFNSPETVAAAVAYTAQRINRLVALSASPQGNRIATPDEQALRNSIEHDRYGFVAYVLSARDKCQPQQCAAFAAMTDHKQVSANMEALIYEELVARYAPGWPANVGSGIPATVGVPMATGKPSTIDFPTADSIPPVSIMTEPAPSRPAAQLGQTDPPAQSNGAAGGAGGPYVPARQSAAQKRPEGQKRLPAASDGPAGPVQLAPTRPAQ